MSKTFSVGIYFSNSLGISHAPRALWMIVKGLFNNSDNRAPTVRLQQAYQLNHFDTSVEPSCQDQFPNTPWDCHRTADQLTPFQPPQHQLIGSPDWQSHGSCQDQSIKKKLYRTRTNHERVLSGGLKYGGLPDETGRNVSPPRSSVPGADMWFYVHSFCPQLGQGRSI